MSCRIRLGRLNQDPNAIARAHPKEYEKGWTIYCWRWVLARARSEWWRRSWRLKTQSWLHYWIGWEGQYL